MGCPLTVVLVLDMLLAGGTAAAAEQRVFVLNGFEPEVLKGWAERRKAPEWSYLRVVRMGKDGIPYGGGMTGRLVEGDATQGRFAMVRQIPAEGGRGPDYSLGFLKNEDTKESIRRSVGTLLNTFGTFRDFYPQDWSPYENLRLDIKSEASPLRLRVELEDGLIAPAVKRIYDVPAGKWVTVEVDLAEAARPRDVVLPEAEAKHLGVNTLKGRPINLKEMANLRITIEHLEARTTVKLDNLRLVAPGAGEGETTLPVLTDNRPFPVPTALPRSEPRPRERLACPLNTAPIQWEPPVDIPLTGASYGVQVYDVAPVDNDRMLLAVGTASVLKTVDGGKTWTGLDGAANRPTKVIDHDTNAPGRGAAAMGPDLMVLGVAKCSGGSLPVDSYSILTRFDGKDWQVRPRGLVDIDNRHCPEWMVEMVRLPGGRIWACWLRYNRFGTNDLCARWSDDEGQTWRDAASNGLLHLTTRGVTNPLGITWWLEGRASPAWAASQALGRVCPMDHRPPEIAAFGDHVMCAFVQRQRIAWASFDGAKWGPPTATGIRGDPASLAHLEGRTVYLAATDGKVYRLEGDQFVEDTPPGGVGQGRLPYPGCSRTRLSAAGSGLVATWTDGNKIFTSAKPKDGTWSPPREVCNEERGVHWIGAPVRSVENFVPLVWSVKGGGARFVRIPVQQPTR